MSAELLLRNFERVATSGAAVQGLRDLTLALALRGRLVASRGSELESDALIEQVVAAGASRLGARWTARARQLAAPISGPYPIPPGWTWIRFGLLYELVRGVTYTKSDVSETLVTGYLPILRASNIQESLNFDDLVYVKTERVSQDQKPRAGDFVIALSSGSKNLVGKAAFVARDFHGGIGGFCGIVRVGLPATAAFIGIYLASQLYRESIAAGSQGIGINNLQRSSLDNLAFPLAPLAAQNRIVAKVDELMGLCNQLEAAQKEREARRDGLRAASLHKLTASDDDVMPGSADVRFFLKTSPRLITKPEHVGALRGAILDLAVRGRLVPPNPRSPWRHTTLGALGAWGSGGTPDKGRADFYGGDIPWVVIGDLNESLVTETASTLTELGLRSSSAKMIEAGAVLIAMYGASVGKLGIAGVPCATNQAIAHCIPDPSVVERDYLWLCLRGLRKALIASGRGGAQPNISQSILKAWPVLLPLPAEQRHIVSRVDQLEAVCDQLQTALASAQDGRARLLDALLHEALEGGAVRNSFGTRTAG